MGSARPRPGGQEGRYPRMLLGEQGSQRGAPGKTISLKSPAARKLYMDRLLGASSAAAVQASARSQVRPFIELVRADGSHIAFFQDCVRLAAVWPATEKCRTRWNRASSHRGGSLMLLLLRSPFSADEVVSICGRLLQRGLDHQGEKSLKLYESHCCSSCVLKFLLRAESNPKKTRAVPRNNSL